VTISQIENKHGITKATGLGLLSFSELNILSAKKILSLRLQSFFE